MADALFDGIARFQGGRPWGRVLDAGTGKHSLSWLRGLGAEEVVAVTATPSRARELGCLFGDWADESLLFGERFDTVLVDYLLGALDGFAPYYQDRLFERLHRHVRGRLYVVGMEPFGEEDNLVTEIARLRDACILLAGDRCYREYPRTWALRTLERSGYRVVDSWALPILFRERWVQGQLDVCLRKLPRFKSAALAEAMREHIEDCRSRSLAGLPLEYGSDYIVVAEPI